MSDIGLDLPGLIALCVFVLSAIILAICGVVSLIIAVFKGSKTWHGTKRSGAFGFFIAAVPLILLNAAAFGVLIAFVDSFGRETNEIIDNVAFFTWLPLMAVVWIILGLAIKKRRSKASETN